MKIGDKIYCKKAYYSETTIFNIKGKNYEILDIVDISLGDTPFEDFFYIIKSENFRMDVLGLKRDTVLLEKRQIREYFITSQEVRKEKLKQINDK